MFNTDLLNGETENGYIWRLGQAKENGLLDMTWEEIAALINKAFRDDETLYRSESAYRKRYNNAKDFNADVFSKENRSNELDEQIRELERKKIQFRDYKRSWNKQNYEASRFDEVMELLQERLDNFAKADFRQVPELPYSLEDDAMICCLSDLHIGQTFSSAFGEYNSEIAKERLEKYLHEVIKIGKLHGVNRVYVALLGDDISNSLHKTIEVTNKENVIDQLKLSIEYITSFVYELTKYFKVYLAAASGNHSRLQAKDLAQHSERLDAFVAWDVARVLESNNNFCSLLHRSIDDGIADINVLGKTYLLVHGDFDTPDKNGYMKLAAMCGVFPENIFCGHKHFCFYNQESKFVQSGSLASSGCDYTIEKRLTGKASQMVCIVDKNGIKACYPVMLS